MEMSTLSIELSEVFCQWLKDPSQINCRISIKSKIQVIKYQQQVTIELINPNSVDQVHILIQEDNIVLGSLTVTLEWMFGSGLSKDLDEWINIEVPVESILLITKQQVKEIDAKSLRIRLTGKLISPEPLKVQKPSDPEPVQTPTFESLSPLKNLAKDTSPEASSPSYEIKVETIEESKDQPHADHRKMPSEADSLEKEPQNPKTSHLKPLDLSENNPSNTLKEPTSALQQPEAKSPGIKSPFRSPRSKSPPARTEKLSPPTSPKVLFVAKPAHEKKSPQPDQKSMKSPKGSPEKPIPSLEDSKKPTSQFTFSGDSESPPKTIGNDKKKITDESLSIGSSELSSENEDESPAQVARARPMKINLSAESITNPCGYLRNVVKVEWHLKTIMSILNKLKEEMGGQFLKLIEESTRRDSRSPTRSPSRKLTNSGLRTPGLAQRSLNASVISSFRVEEENILDIPGYVDVFLDRLSIKNADILSTCVVGLIAKNTFGSVQSREIDPTKDAISQQEKTKNMISDSMKATSAEFAQECDNFDVMIKRLKDEIASISYSTDSTRKKTQLLEYEKSTHEKSLEKLKTEREEILKKYNATFDLDTIKQLRKANETLEKARIDMEEKLTSYAIQYKSTFEGSSALQIKFIEEKTSLLSEVKTLTSITDNIERENQKLRSELQGLTGFIYVDDEFRKMLASCQNNSRSHSLNMDSIRTQLTYLRSQKEDLANDAAVLQQKIEAETKRVKTSQSGWNREIEMNNEIISNLNKDFKKLKQEVNYIEDVYSKKLNVENAFDVISNKARHNQETKDQLISELSYFSDFVFSLSQTFLQQKRIFEKVKSIVSEKEMEVEAMRTAVHELKHSNPVYFPVAEDIIDQAIADYFNSRDDVLIVPFVRESYGVYLYGSKRVMVNIERGKLIVKVGGGFLPIEVFIDNYTDVELDKYDNKNVEVSPQMRKFMAKWVGGLNPRQISPEKMKEGLVKAMEGHKFTQAYGIKDARSVVIAKKAHEDFITPDRPDTPIIEEDI